MNESQNADKIYNIDEVSKANFGTEITDALNVNTGNISASGNVILGNTTINYGVNGEIKINHFLTGAPFSASFFIGRENDLNQLEEAFEKNNLVLLSGEGGLGKTSLAAQYWKENAKNFTHIAWLNAENGIHGALISLKESLQVAFDDKDTETQQIERVLRAIANLKPSCFFVFDNVDEEKYFDDHYTTLCRLTNCKILVTTRLPKYDEATVYSIQPLSEADAVKLFLHYYIDIKEKEIELLHLVLEAVGYNTLVIELLAKNLAVYNENEQVYSLQNLVLDVQSKGLLAIANKKVKTHYHNLQPAKLNEIISVMYDLSKLTDYEKYLLSNLAVLPAENIPYNILKELLNPENAEDFSDSLSALNAKGWLSRNTEKAFKISPVIQEIIRHKNKTALWNDCETLLYTFKNRLEYDQLHEKENYKLTLLWSKYTESILTYFKEPHEVAAVLCERIGTYFTTYGNLNKALFYFEKSLDISKQLCALEPENTWNKNALAISYEKLGGTNAALGYLDASLKFYEEYNNLEKQLFKDFSNNIEFKDNLAISYQYLGLTHAQLGNLDKAWIFYEDYNILIKQLYDEFPDNVKYKNGLAISCEKFGDKHFIIRNLDVALKFYEEYNNLEKQLFDDFPDIVEYKNNLAISYEKLGNTHSILGNLDKALKFYEDNYVLAKQLYDEFPDNAKYKNGLAISYLLLGKLYEEKKKDNSQAKNYYLQCEKIYIELFATWQDVRYKGNLTLVQNRLAALG